MADRPIRHALLSTVHEHTQRHLDLADLAAFLKHSPIDDQVSIERARSLLKRAKAQLQAKRDIPCDKIARGTRSRMTTDCSFYALARPREVNAYYTSVKSYFEKAELAAGDHILAGDIYSDAEFDRFSTEDAATLRQVFAAYRKVLQVEIPNVRILHFTPAELRALGVGLDALGDVWAVLWPARLVRFKIDHSVKPWHVPVRADLPVEALRSFVVTQIRHRIARRHYHLCPEVSLTVDASADLDLDILPPAQLQPEVRTRKTHEVFEFDAYHLWQQAVAPEASTLPLSVNLTGLKYSDSGKADAVSAAPATSPLQWAVALDFTLNPDFVSDKAAQLDTMLAWQKLRLTTTDSRTLNEHLAEGWTLEQSIESRKVLDLEVIDQHYDAWARLRGRASGEIAIDHHAFCGGILITGDDSAPKVLRRGPTLHSRCGRFRVYNQVFAVGIGYIRKYVLSLLKSEQAPNEIDFMAHLISLADQDYRSFAEQLAPTGLASLFSTEPALVRKRLRQELINVKRPILDELPPMIRATRALMLKAEQGKLNDHALTDISAKLQISVPDLVLLAQDLVRAGHPLH